MVFRGQSQRSLDPKGRLMLPLEFRDVLLERSTSGACVLTTFENCIMVYPEPEWAEFEEQISRMRSATRKLRDFRRLMLGGAETHTLDAQGRLRLSKPHQDYAKLTGNVVVVGQGHLFEIWDQEAFRTLQEQDFGDVADELAEHGIELPL